MDRRLALIMAREAHQQANFAFIAVKAIDENIDNMFKNVDFTMEHFWFNMQMFLVSTANVSKILWGNYETDREIVRDFFQIKNDSALKSRRLRNHLEHYDERLINWDNNSSQKNMASNIIGTDNAIRGIHPKDIFRHYNPEYGKFTFRGETFYLKPVVKEIKKILAVDLPVF